MSDNNNEITINKKLYTGKGGVIFWNRVSKAKKYLIKEKIKFRMLQGGLHLTFRLKNCDPIDFYPSSGYWHNKISHEKGQGLGKLKDYIYHKH